MILHARLDVGLPVSLVSCARAKSSIANHLGSDYCRQYHGGHVPPSRSSLRYPMRRSSPPSRLKVQSSHGGFPGSMGRGPGWTPPANSHLESLGPTPLFHNTDPRLVLIDEEL
jgi:hypothetical protein